MTKKKKCLVNKSPVQLFEGKHYFAVKDPNGRSEFSKADFPTWQHVARNLARKNYALEKKYMEVMSKAEELHDFMILL